MKWFKIWCGVCAGLAVSACGGGQSALQEPSSRQTIEDNSVLPQVMSAAAKAVEVGEAAMRDLVMVGGKTYALTSGGLVISRDDALDDAAQRQAVVLGDGGVRLAVSGSRVLVASGKNGVRIVDLTDQAKPVLAGTFAPQSGEAQLVAAEGDLALVGLGEQGVAVIDTSDAAKPVERKLLPELRHSADLALRGRWGYVLDKKLTVLDLAKPEEPKVAAQVDLRDRGLALALDGERMLVAGEKGYYLYDIKRPEEPARLAELDQADVAKSNPNQLAKLDGQPAPTSDERLVWHGPLAAMLRDGRVFLLAVGEKDLSAVTALDALGPAVGVVQTAAGPRLLSREGDLIEAKVAEGKVTESARHRLVTAPPVEASNGSSAGPRGQAPLGAPALTTSPEAAADPTAATNAAAGAPRSAQPQPIEPAQPAPDTTAPEPAQPVQTPPPGSVSG